MTDFGKIIDGSFDDKQKSIVDLTMSRLNIKKGSDNPKDAMKIAIMLKVDELISSCALPCMMSDIPMMDIFEVIRATLDMTELTVKEAKKHCEGK